MGDDPNFATTVTNLIGGKANAGDEDIIDNAWSIWNADGDGDVFTYGDHNPTWNGKYVGAMIDVRGDGVTDNSLVKAGIFTGHHISTSNGYYVGSLLHANDSVGGSTTQVIDSSGNWVGGTITGASDANVSNWNTAHGWGNHASAGYASSSHSHAYLPTTLSSGYTVGMGSWGLRNTTPHGYIQFGPANTSHAHIYTDRSNFYFNVDTMYANGHIMLHANNYSNYANLITNNNQLTNGAGYILSLIHI